MKIYAGFIGEQLEQRVRLDPELIDKPITIFYDYPLRDLSELNYNPYNILFIQEPNQLFGFHDWTVKYGYYFDAIFTWGETIINHHPNNTMFFPFGAGNRHIISKYDANKVFEVSFLCGEKNLIEGHHLRYRILAKQNEVTISNNFMHTAPREVDFDGKEVCWRSMYHIAVENSRNNGYFTEKIIDAFLSKTIPIYWGCPNIHEYFNTDGILIFNDETDLIDIVNNLTPDYYESKKEVIEENYLKACQYADFVGRINKLIKEICIQNNI
jgi:hypothetical protein